MKAQKLEAILKKYPWLRQELGGAPGQEPDHTKFEYVSIKVLNDTSDLINAREEIRQKPRDGKPDVFERVAWTILFRLGNEELLRGRSVTWQGDKENENEQTVDGVIRHLEAWYQEFWAKQEVPMVLVALLKKVFRQVGATPLPARLTVYLLNTNLEIVEWHYYVPPTFGQEKPIICGICQNPIQHDIALTVLDKRTGERFKAHVACLFPKTPSKLEQREAL